MLRLEVIWSEDGYDNLDEKKQFTVWNPEHFKAELKLVVEEIKRSKPGT